MRPQIYDPAYIKKDIHPAVDKIMKEYPVKPLKTSGSNTPSG